MPLAAGQYYGVDGAIWQTTNTDGGDVLIAPAPQWSPDSISSGWGAPANTDSFNAQPQVQLAGLTSDSGVSLLESIGFKAPQVVGASLEQGYSQSPQVLGYLIDHNLDVRQTLAAPGTMTATGRGVDSIIQTFDSSGAAVGVSANVAHVNDDAFGLTALAATLFAGAAAAGAAGASSGGAAASSSSAGGIDALGWGAGYAVPGTGAYAGLSTAQLGALSAGLDAGLSVSAAEAAAGFGGYSSAASPAIAGGSGAAAPVASAAAPSIFGSGGVLGAVGQVAGLVGTGAGLVGKLLGGSPSSSLSPGQVAQLQANAAAAQQRTLLLIAGAVALVVILRK